MYLLVYDFFRSHHNYFRDTVSWECFVEDDCVRSCLIELQSFPLSNLYVDPVHCILVHFPLLLVQRKTWSGQIELLCVGFTAVKNTVCLSLLEFCPPASNPEFMECKLTALPI